MFTYGPGAVLGSLMLLLCNDPPRGPKRCSSPLTMVGQPVLRVARLIGAVLLALTPRGSVLMRCAVAARPPLQGHLSRHLRARPE